MSVTSLTKIIEFANTDILLKYSTVEGIRLVILNAIWQRCAILLERARLAKRSHRSVRVSTPSVANYHRRGFVHKEFFPPGQTLN